MTTPAKNAPTKPAAKQPSKSTAKKPTAAKQPAKADVKDEPVAAQVQTAAATPETDPNAKPPEVPAVKKVLDPKVALDAGLTMAVKSYVGLGDLTLEADATRAHARGIMVRMGMEVPDDGADAGDPPVAKKKASPGRPAASASATPSPDGGSTLWQLVENHLFTGGFIAPKYEQASTIKAIAEKAGFTTAANLLSNKSRMGDLVKGERGEYALPKGYKRK